MATAGIVTEAGTESQGIAKSPADYAHQISQIVIGYSGRTRLQEMAQGSIVNDLIRLVRGIDVLVVANSVPYER